MHLTASARPRVPASATVNLSPPNGLFGAVFGSMGPSFSHILKRCSSWGRIRGSEAARLRVEGLKFIGGSDNEFGRIAARKTVKVRGKLEERIVKRSVQISQNRLLTQGV